MFSDFHVIVQKFGGSSVNGPDRIKAVAGFIKTSIVPGRRICVVVSAMGHSTNEFISLAHRVAKRPNKREMDMLISCGERSSMALLAMALNDIGISAMSLTGSQSGIITSNNHSEADIIAIRPHRVIESFKTHQVVIVAGFQGVSRDREITTLRRGGSDTTAVAMAAALDARLCEIYTDVPGVMDIDPRITSRARLIDEISYDQMEAMAFYGARVLAHDAIVLAKDFGIEVRVKMTGEPEGGTVIGCEKKLLMKGQPLIRLTHLRSVIRFFLSHGSEKFGDVEGYLLCGSIKPQGFLGYASADLSQELLACQGTESGPRLALITIHLARSDLVLKALSIVQRLFGNPPQGIEDLIIGKNEIFLIIADDGLMEGLAILSEGLFAMGRSYEQG